MQLLRGVPSERRGDVVAVLVLAVTCVALYGATLCRTVYWYDSAEFAAHAAALGVPHPPGYPLYTLIAHLFTWLPGEPALGVNVMSLTFGVIAVLLGYGLARAIGCAPWSAAGAALLLATARTFWGNAIVAEVYTPGLTFCMVVWLLLWRAEQTGSRRTEALAAFVAGLAVGVHMSITTLGLGYAWLVWTRPEPGEAGGARRRRLARSGVAAASTVAGLLVFLYIPLRTFERWNRAEWIRFYKNATGGTFRRKFHGVDPIERSEQMFGIFADNLHVVGLALAVIGFAWLLRRDRRWGVALLLGVVGNVGLFFTYHVPDLDVFVLPGMALCAIAAGQGMEALAIGLRRLHPRAVWALLALAAIPAVHVAANYADLDLSERDEAARYAADVCDSIDRPAVMVTYSAPEEWRHYAVFLYVQNAFGQCKDVEVWTKPSDDRVRALLRHPRRKAYAFLPLERLQAFADLAPEGVLWRISPKDAARSAERSPGTPS